MQDIFVWSTIILLIWGAVAPLVGVRYGQELAKRWHDEHWILDNKKAEFREVLQALSAAVGPIIQCGSPGNIVGPEEMRAATLAENAVHAVLENRLFIARELDELHADDRWRVLVDRFGKEKNALTLLKGFKDISDDIRAAAIGSINKSTSR
jgi:hypothetical protein